MKAIGIDIGTTTISAVVVELENGTVLEAENVPNDSFIETENSWERIQKVEQIVKRAKLLLDDMLERYPDCRAIGLTGQMHGIVYVNHLGLAVSPLYTWQDGRGNRNEFGPDGNQTLVQLVTDKTGSLCASGYGLVTHLYQERKKLVPEDATSICTIADYFGMVLTGRKTPLLHASNAASFGFFDVEHGTFREEVIASLGADPKILPEVTGEIAVLGSYRRVPVTVAIGDNQASFLGAVGNQEHTVLLNMGTGGQISVLSKEYVEADGVEARPFLNGTYLLVGASLCGGRAYAILEQFFRSYMKMAACEKREKQQEDGTVGGSESMQPSARRPESEFHMDAQYGTMERLAEAGRRMAMSGKRNGETAKMEKSGETYARDPMVVTTAFCGTRANPNLRGSITGISEKNFTPECLVYGVLCGMAEELYGYFRNIDVRYHIPVKRLVASGNGLRKNRVLREIFEELFQAELSLSPYEEEAACGAARCSLFIT